MAEKKPPKLYKIQPRVIGSPHPAPPDIAEKPAGPRTIGPSAPRTKNQAPKHPIIPPRTSPKAQQRNAERRRHIQEQAAQYQISLHEHQLRRGDLSPQQRAAHEAALAEQRQKLADLAAEP